jgi:hypothetical protein
MLLTNYHSGEIYGERDTHEGEENCIQDFGWEGKVTTLKT